MSLSHHGTSRPAAGALLARILAAATLLLVTVPTPVFAGRASGSLASEAKGPLGITVQAMPVGDGSMIDYQMAVVNRADREAAITIHQELPPGSSGVTSKDGKVDGREITWQTKVKPSATVTVTSTARPPESAAEPLTTACVTDKGRAQIVDCAASGIPMASMPQWWKDWSWALLIAASVTVALLLLIGTALWRRWARHLEDPRSTGRNVIAGVAALAILALLVGGAVRLTNGHTGSGGAELGVSSRGWYGPHEPLKLGSAASDGVLEFTAYRASCTDTAQRTCTIVTRVHNISAEPQQWRRSMQRLYVARQSWTTPDAKATAKANGGRDIFSDTIAPDEPFIAVLVFPIPEDAEPLRVELREGIFARGVYLTL